jgi:hypothetical protein
MSFFSKLRIAAGREGSPITPPITRVHMPAGGYVSAPGSRNSSTQSDLRVSNGIKEFLWHLDGLGRGTLLDLGPAWQTTISFFVERGFKVYAEDVLRAWKDFLASEEDRLRNVTLESDPTGLTPESRAVRFLEANLQYSPGSFDAMLLWDLLDYLEPALAKRMVAHLTELIRPGGVLLAMFHSKKPEGFNRYRVVDTQTLQVLPTPILCPAQRVYQNREIQDLFRLYRTSKSFVGRDQLREVLFLK